MDAQEIIYLLGLQPLPEEGGFYHETYRCQETVEGAYGPRSLSTCIYYLVTPESFSGIHRLPSDEIFHFYLGDPVEILRLYPDGSGEVSVMGHDLAASQRPQLLVPRGTWQGSALAPGGRFALLGTVVSPGFDFADYESGPRARLQADYPAFRDQIARLTPLGS